MLCTTCEHMDLDGNGGNVCGYLKNNPQPIDANISKCAVYVRAEPAKPSIVETKPAMPAKTVDVPARGRRKAK